MLNFRPSKRRLLNEKLLANGVYAMYGVPNKEALQCFVGKELIQICFGATHVIFRFSDDVEISLEVAIKQVLPDGRVFVTDECWKQETWLPMLLGATVDLIDAIENKILRLKFSNGHTIEVVDESKEYESFQIKISDRLIVV